MVETREKEERAAAYWQEVERLAVEALSDGDRNKEEFPDGDDTQAAYEHADNEAGYSKYAQDDYLIAVTFVTTKHPLAPYAYHATFGGSGVRAEKASPEDQAWLMLRADVFARIEEMRPGYFNYKWNKEDV